MKQFARDLLNEFKGETYRSGNHVLDGIGEMIPEGVNRISIVVDPGGRDWLGPYMDQILKSLESAGKELAGEYISGARPNAPREDVFRMAGEIGEQDPDLVISLGGGSTIDAVKAAIAFTVLGGKYPDLDAYFGMGQVSEMLGEEKKEMIPHLAVMTAASSAAHLTKYSNVTDLNSGQKMLIVDEGVVPGLALFDYSLTATQPHALTVDGALDGISHSLEVFMGIPEANLDRARSICLTGIELIVNNVNRLVEDPGDLEAREAVGLGTDLGGYAIMVGGTNGAHLNSFSMTDILTHGRACALMNPYYVVFFANAIDGRLKEVGEIFSRAGYITADLDQLAGKELGVAVAEGMQALSKKIGFPVTLSEVPGFNESHIKKCLEAAKNPKLESKLKNMPVPLSSDLVDEYMGSVLEAAVGGEMSLIKSLAL